MNYITNDTVFKTREEPTPEAPQSPKTGSSKVEQPNRVPEPLGEMMRDPLPSNLEAWEFESNKKYVNEYFNTHNIGHEFTWKMPLAQIDKYIKGELESREYEKTTKNYEKILQEIETEIGSGPLELSKRLRKIIGFLGILKKQKALRALKQKYVGLDEKSVWD